jgi:hypothetical protein
MFRKYRILLLAPLALLLALPASAPAQTARRSPPSGNKARVRKARSSLAQKIIRFGLAHLGKPTADRGMTAYTCANFVAAALHSANAKSTEDFGVSGANGNLDYVWGKRVLTHRAGSPDSDFQKVQPGDVIQFRNVQGPRTGGVYRQHTAIVYQNLGGGKFVVLEQNFNNQKFVTRDTIDMSRLTSGTMWVYRPVRK